MGGSIFDAISNAVSSFISSLTNAFTGIQALLITANTSGSTTTYEPTFLGYVLLASIGVGVVVWAFSLIRGAVRGIAG